MCLSALPLPLSLERERKKEKQIKKHPTNKTWTARKSLFLKKYMHLPCQKQREELRRILLIEQRLRDYANLNFTVRCVRSSAAMKMGSNVI